MTEGPACLGLGVWFLGEAVHDALRLEPRRRGPPLTRTGGERIPASPPINAKGTLIAAGSTRQGRSQLPRFGRGNHQGMRVLIT